MGAHQHLVQHAALPSDGPQLTPALPPAPLTWISRDTTLAFLTQDTSASGANTTPSAPARAHGGGAGWSRLGTAAAAGPPSHAKAAPISGNAGWPALPPSTHPPTLDVDLDKVKGGHARPRRHVGHREGGHAALARRRLAEHLRAAGSAGGRRSILGSLILPCSAALGVPPCTCACLAPTRQAPLGGQRTRPQAPWSPVTVMLALRLHRPALSACILSSLRNEQAAAGARVQVRARPSAATSRRAAAAAAAPSDVNAGVCWSRTRARTPPCCGAAPRSWRGRAPGPPPWRPATAA